MSPCVSRSGLWCVEETLCIDVNCLEVEPFHLQMTFQSSWIYPRVAVLRISTSTLTSDLLNENDHNLLIELTPMVTELELMDMSGSHTPEPSAPKAPEGWRIDLDYLEYEEYPFAYYDLPPAKIYFHNSYKATYFVESDGRFILWNENGFMDQIIEPKTLQEICEVLHDMSKLTTVPLVRADTESVTKQIPTGWTKSQWYVSGDVEAPFENYGMPPAKKLLYNKVENQYLVVCEDRHFFVNEDTDDLVEIWMPRRFDAIMQAMVDEEPLTQVPIQPRTSTKMLGTGSMESTRG